MNTYLPMLAVALMAIFFALLAYTWLTSRPHSTGLAALANIGEGIWSGAKTFRTDSAIASRGLLVKFGSDADHVALAGAADIPLGYVTDEAAAAEDPIAVELFGIQPKTAIGVASGVIANGALLVPDAAGKIRTLPAGAGNYWIIGRAAGAAGADGDPIHYIPLSPVLRVI